jgi:hypothetical protein
MPLATLYRLYRMTYILILAHLTPVLLQLFRVSLSIWFLFQYFVPLLTLFNVLFYWLKRPSSPFIFSQNSHLLLPGTDFQKLLADHFFVDHFDQGEDIICGYIFKLSQPTIFWACPHVNQRYNFGVKRIENSFLNFRHISA